MRSAGKARGLLYAALACYLTLQPVPAHALLVSAGETARIDFDLSGEAVIPPYGELQINLDFGAGDLFDPGDVFTFNIFDTEGGSSIGNATVGPPGSSKNTVSASAGLFPATADGIGFYLLGVDLGSFELTSATVQGINFELSPPDDTTTAVTATISPVSPVPLPAALPLFLSALAGLGLFGWRRRVKAAA